MPYILTDESQNIREVWIRVNLEIQGERTMKKVEKSFSIWELFNGLFEYFHIQRYGIIISVHYETLQDPRSC